MTQPLSRSSTESLHLFRFKSLSKCFYPHSASPAGSSDMHTTKLRNGEDSAYISICFCFIAPYICGMAEPPVWCSLLYNLHASESH